MASYVDGRGVTRHIEIDVAAIERLRSRLGVDLFDPSSLGEALGGDVLKSLKVIHCVQDRQGVLTFDDWFDSHKGDGASNAAEAFLEAYCDFCPSRQAKMIRDFNKAAGREIENALEELGRTFGALPAS